MSGGVTSLEVGKECVGVVVVELCEVGNSLGYCREFVGCCCELGDVCLSVCDLLNLRDNVKYRRVYLVDDGLVLVGSCRCGRSVLVIVERGVVCCCCCCC